MPNWPISGLAAEQITVSGCAPADRLGLAGDVVQYPPYQGIAIIGTRDEDVHFPPSFVLAFPISLCYPVMKGSGNVPLNQIQLLIREEVLRFANVNVYKRQNRPAF